ncbi:intermembrane transport protein PqiB [Porticoccaceae bacterium LTM1]|nr:intermembrane transport protein PqiB [Porticoccaceae bacterium LTM1]
MLAKVSKKRGISVAWLLPILALVFCLWILLQQWLDKGATITIECQTASGLEVDKTKVRIRDVDVGVVTDIQLSDDYSKVIVSAQLDNEVSDLLTEEAQFWVVSPRVTSSGVSGLNTLLSGVYIEWSPGYEGEEQRNFIALDHPPITPAGTPGLHVALISEDRFEYTVGDPVIYKGLTVGRIEDVDYSLDTGEVRYSAFIEAPYHQLINTNTRFWNSSGVSVSLNADGLNVETESLVSLLMNAVSFGELSPAGKGNPIDAKTRFHIYANREEANHPTYLYRLNYILLISDSVRGLSVGAPVQYRGLEIGEVLEINVSVPDRPTVISNDYQIPVLITIQPGKLGLEDTRENQLFVQEQISQWTRQGLKAQLQTGNLLTGQLYVELQHFPDLQVASVERFDDYPVIPVRANDYSQIAIEAGRLLAKLNELPLDDLAGSANDLMSGLTESVAVLSKVGNDLQVMLKEANQEELISQINDSLKALSVLARGYSEGSSSYDELVKLMESVNTRLLDLKPLLRTLKEQPNSLIFGVESEEERIPRRSPAQ